MRHAAASQSPSDIRTFLKPNIRRLFDPGLGLHTREDADQGRVAFSPPIAGVPPKEQFGDGDKADDCYFSRNILLNGGSLAIMNGGYLQENRHRDCIK